MHERVFMPIVQQIYGDHSWMVSLTAAMSRLALISHFLAGLASNPLAMMGMIVSCHGSTHAAAASAVGKKDTGPRPVVISGPSGAGKSTFLKRLMKEEEGLFALSVSHTTRDPRPGEQDGVDYHYTTKEAMQQAVSQGEFVEHATFGGNMYGTSKRAIQNVADAGRICILDIEMQGCESIRALPEFDPLFIFVMPPSVDALEARLRARGTETEESLQKRLAEATSAIEYGNSPGKFDHVIVNDDLEAAYSQFKACLEGDIAAARELQQS